MHVRQPGTFFQFLSSCAKSCHVDLLLSLPSLRTTSFTLPRKIFQLQSDHSPTLALFSAREEDGSLQSQSCHHSVVRALGAPDLRVAAHVWLSPVPIARPDRTFGHVHESGFVAGSIQLPS